MADTLLPEIIIENAPEVCPIAGGTPIVDADGVMIGCQLPYGDQSYPRDDSNLYPADDVREAFAPPVPEVLPEITIRPPTTTPVPAPILPGIVRTIGTGLLGLLIPTVTAPRELDEPQGPLRQVNPDDFLPVLPEVEVVMFPNPLRPPSKPPGAAAPRIGNDPIMPPNWSDLLDVYRPGWPQPFAPLPFGPDVDLPVDQPRAAPRPADEPTRTPRSTPDPGPDLFPTLQPGRPASPAPDRVAPDLFVAPLPDLTAGPRFDLDPAPAPRVPTRPGTGSPGPSLDPWLDFPAFFAPGGTGRITPTVPDLGIDLDPIGLPKFDAKKIPDEADSCSCAKKKPKKKRKPRAVCYRGTYRETQSGLIKNKQEEVPCKGRDAAPTTRTKRSKAKTIGDLAKDIFTVRFNP